MKPNAKNLAAAGLLGAACACRCFSGPGALALRGRPADRRARGVILALTVGEAIADKLPFAGPRSDPPALAGRAVSGGLCGAVAAGIPGAIVGAASAFALTGPSERARARIVERFEIPDPACAVAEDALVYGAAWVASAALTD